MIFVIINCQKIFRNTFLSQIVIKVSFKRTTVQTCQTFNTKNKGRICSLSRFLVYYVWADFRQLLSIISLGNFFYQLVIHISDRDSSLFSHCLIFDRLQEECDCIKLYIDSVVNGKHVPVFEPNEQHITYSTNLSKGKHEAKTWV